MKRNRDVKFVIYQVLYIFVVAVIALKGANLDLSEVITKDKVVEKSYADSLRKYIDSLLALGLVPEIKFDTTKKFSTPEELQQRLKEVTTQLQIATSNISPTMTVSTTSPTITSSFTTNNPEVQQQQEQQKIEEKIESDNPEAVVTVPQGFTQFTVATISNRNSAPMEVVGHGSIGPGSSKQVTLGGESSLTFKVGSVTRTVPVKENSKPKISLQRLVAAGEEVSIRRIQGTVGYRVTISDDFPGNLNVNISGPVQVKQTGDNTYDITLNFIQSQAQFERFTESKDAPYSVSFQVAVTDKLAGHSLRQSGVFQFGEW